MNETISAAIVPEIVQDNYPEHFLTALTSEKINKSEVPAILAEFEFSISLFDAAQRSRAIVVTDESQTGLMSQAREFRLKLKNERVRLGKIKDSLKEPYLRKTQVIDGIHRILRRMFESEEEHLQKQEDFAKIKEQERITLLADTRKERLLQYDFADEVPGLGVMVDTSFDLLLAGAKAKFDAHLADVKRKEQEENDRIERETELREENERLHLQTVEANRKAEAERLERERIENAARIEHEESERKERDRIAADRAKQLAPDREKFLNYAQDIRRLVSDAPRMSSDEARRELDGFRAKLAEIQNEMEDYADSLKLIDPETVNIDCKPLFEGDCPF